MPLLQRKEPEGYFPLKMCFMGDREAARSAELWRTEGAAQTGRHSVPLSAHTLGLRVHKSRILSGFPGLSSCCSSEESSRSLSLYVSLSLPLFLFSLPPIIPFISIKFFT